MNDAIRTCALLVAFAAGTLNGVYDAMWSAVVSVVVLVFTWGVQEAWEKRG